MQVVSIPDITPNGVATPIAAAVAGKVQHAVWITFTCSGTTGRIGDSGVGSTEGLVVGQNSPHSFQRCDFAQGGYDLTGIYVYATGADKFSIVYGV